MCAGRLVAPAPTRGRPMRPVDDGVAAPHSWLARMDPLAKLCAALATILVISTLPTGAGWRYPAILVLLICIAAVATVPARYLLRRALAATPFVAMAAAMPIVSGVPDGAAMALAVGWKAYSAIVLLSLLGATTPIADLIESLRRLGAPRGLALTATLMHRYLNVLLAEWRRIVRARDCRAFGRTRVRRTRLWANQAAMVFVRGWDRADRVSHAMLARGFRGDFPGTSRSRPPVRDVVLCVALPALVLALRMV